MNLVSCLLCVFFVCFIFCSSSFYVIGVSVVVVGSEQTYARTRDYPLFSHLQVTTSPFARVRASLILILYSEKWLIINSSIFSISSTVFGEMHILSWRF